MLINYFTDTKVGAYCYKYRTCEDLLFCGGKKSVAVAVSCNTSHIQNFFPTDSKPSNESQPHGVQPQGLCEYLYSHSSATALPQPCHCDSDSARTQTHRHLVHL